MQPDRPSAAVIEHDVSAHDGWPLNVIDLPAAGPACGVAILGHAMMVDRRTVVGVGAPTLGRTLTQHGLRVLVPDLRGRGKSGPTPRQGGDWSYADLVADVGTYVDLARRLAPELPVVLVGHSLFGHAALAWLGTHPQASVAAMAGLGVHVWGRAWVSGRLRWWGRRLLVAGTELVAALYGYMPSGRTGFGTCDEARSYWRDLAGWVASGRWGDAAHDFHAAMKDIRCPVLHVVSDGDRSFGAADEALRWSAVLGSWRSVLRIGASASDRRLRGLAPAHMAMVTSRASEPIWTAVAEWLVARTAG